MATLLAAERHAGSYDMLMIWPGEGCGQLQAVLAVVQQALEEWECI